MLGWGREGNIFALEKELARTLVSLLHIIASLYLIKIEPNNC